MGRVDLEHAEAMGEVGRFWARVQRETLVDIGINGSGGHILGRVRIADCRPLRHEGLLPHVGKLRFTDVHAVSYVHACAPVYMLHVVSCSCSCSHVHVHLMSCRLSYVVLLSPLRTVGGVSGGLSQDLRFASHAWHATGQFSIM